MDGVHSIHITKGNLVDYICCVRQSTRATESRCLKLVTNSHFHIRTTPHALAILQINIAGKQKNGPKLYFDDSTQRNLHYIYVDNQVLHFAYHISTISN